MKLTVEVLKDLGCYPDDHIRRPRTWYFRMCELTLAISPYPDSDDCAVVCMGRCEDVKTVEDLIQFVYRLGEEMRQKDINDKVRTFLSDTFGIHVNA